MPLAGWQKFLVRTLAKNREKARIVTKCSMIFFVHGTIVNSCVHIVYTLHIWQTRKNFVDSIIFKA